MLKIPFIEHTGLSIEITPEVLRWVEVNRLGKRETLKSFGEVVHNNSEASFLGAIQEIMSQIESEAFHLGILLPEALIDVVIEDIPYSEESNETKHWIVQKEKEICDSSEAQVPLIQHHIVQLEEDSKRCIFQVTYGTLIERYVNLLSKLDLFPQYIGTGLLESGYSQIYNHEFVEEVSSLVQNLSEKTYLTIYEKGLIRNVYQIESDGEYEAGFILGEAHSYLQTEEASTDQPINSIPLFIAIKQEGITPDVMHSERSVIKAIPFGGKKGLEELPLSFIRCAGLIVRLFFKGLDSFNFSEAAVLKTGILNHDKKEAIRLAVLLFAPLVIFALLTYGLNKVVDYRLVESNQIMEQIGDKIEEVNHKREELILTRDRFLEARSILEQKEPVAYIFEEISSIIPNDIWLTDLVLDNTLQNAHLVRAVGYSSTERSITVFMSRLEETKEVEETSLMVSEKLEASPRTQSSPSLDGMTRFEIIIRFSGS